MNFCFHCKKGFSSKWNLSRHTNRLHAISQKPLERVNHIGYFTRANHYEQAGRQHEEKWITPQGKENTEWKQMGTGQHHEPNPKESNEDVETEAESDQEDEQNRGDIFDRDSNAASSGNSSSEDSDDCESSSDNSSGDEDSNEDENAIPTEEVAYDGTGNGAEDENETIRQSQSKYLNFARWRDSDHGIYSGWRSLSKKPHVVQHREWLKKILTTPDKLKKPLIMDASDSQLEAFREIADNVARGYAVMRPHMFNIVRKNRRIIQILASEDSSYDQLRRTLLATRTFLMPLLVFFAIPTCIKSDKAALDNLPAE